MDLPLRVAFFSVEFVAVFTLVPFFGYMFYRYMTDGVTPFSPLFPGIMLVLSGATLGLKWVEEINVFLLIFVAATVLFYLVFGLRQYLCLRKAKLNFLKRIADVAFEEEAASEGAEE